MPDEKDLFKQIKKPVSTVIEISAEDYAILESVYNLVGANFNIVQEKSKVILDEADQGNALSTMLVPIFLESLKELQKQGNLLLKLLGKNGDCILKPGDPGYETYGKED